MRRAVALALPLVFLLLMSAVRAQDYAYTTNAGQITITAYFGTGGAVAIPATITGLPVTAIGTDAFRSKNGLTSVTIPTGVAGIGSYAFAFCTNLASVTIPSSITTIGEAAFRGCTSLSSMPIPDGVTSIGDMAFLFCTSLTSLTIPNSVTSIGVGAFGNCTSVTSIEVDAANSFYSSADGVLLDKDQTTLIQFPGGRAGSFTIPNGVTSIGQGAFSYCTSLSSVAIPDSVTSIGVGAFFNCNILTSVTIPDSVTSIGESAFGFCFSLMSVFFEGNAPITGGTYMFDVTPATIYHLPGTTGWLSSFAGRPTVLWNPAMPTDHPSFGVQADQFGFTITGPSDLVVVVEACTNLTSPSWSPVSTNTLTGGLSYFSDPQWSNQPTRVYRLRSP